MFILVIQHNEHSESKESKEASKSIRKQPESQNSKDGLSPWKRAEKSKKSKKQKEKLECLKQGTNTNWQTMRGTCIHQGRKANGGQVKLIRRLKKRWEKHNERKYIAKYDTRENQSLQRNPLDCWNHSKASKLCPLLTLFFCSIYSKLKHCVDYWENVSWCRGHGFLVDKVFLKIHDMYFSVCGQVQDPPLTALIMLIAPITIATLLLPLLCVNLTTRDTETPSTLGF